jgi:tetratricopeptide (TPR) repeat protein
MRLVLLLGLSFIMHGIAAQDGKLKGSDCRQSFRLVKSAISLFKDGEFAEADAKFKESMELNISWHSMNEYAQLKIKEGHIREGNKIYDQIIKKVESLPGNEINYCSGEVAFKHDRNIMYKGIYNLKADINYLNGDINIAIESLKKAFEFGDNDQHLFVGLQMAFYGEDRDATVHFMKLIEKAGGKQLKYLKYGEAFVDILDKNYTAAVEKLLKLEDDGGGFPYSKFYARHTMAIAYALNKEYEKSDAEVKQMLKDPIIGKNFPFIPYIRGINEATKGNYDKAIEFFTDEIKPNKGMYSRQTMALFRYYVARAEAYAGKKDFIKARRDFETALLLKENCTRAIDGLARLEGNIITEIAKDKTPPQIIITEPALSRGLNVQLADGNLLVKGIANDVAGIKAVTINGQLVYSKEDGNFWGNIAVKEGSNKITVIATDNAGNSAEHTFEMQQKKPEIVNTDIFPVISKESKNYVLIVAAQNYEDVAIPSLENPVIDAVKLKQVLKANYNFADQNIKTLFNPGVNEFKKAFADIMEVLQPEDNIIIFYAGHGIWAEKEKKGYWLLTDAKRNDMNTWLDNKVVLDMIAKLPARHTLLITDACFSGSVFKTRSLGSDASQAMREMSEKISRVAITSGNDSEVPDESVFMKYLVKALSENKDKYLTAQKMFITHIIEAVMNETKTEPRYGTLELAGHVGGDFIFVKK